MLSRLLRFACIVAVLGGLALFLPVGSGDFAERLLGPLTGHAARIVGLYKSAQTGTITVSAVTSNTATITSVNTSYSFTVNGGCTNTINGAYNGDRHSGRVVLTNATTVTADKFSATDAIICRYTVIEYWPHLIKSIQSGNIAITVTTNTATITSVNTAATALYHSGCIYSGASTSSEGAVFGRMSLTNATTVTADRGFNDGTTLTCGYVAVESF